MAGRWRQQLAAHQREAQHWGAGPRNGAETAALGLQAGAPALAHPRRLMPGQLYRSSPVYPHCDATFTITVTLPARSASGISCPLMSMAARHKGKGGKGGRGRQGQGRRASVSARAPPVREAPHRRCTLPWQGHAVRVLGPWPGRPTWAAGGSCAGLLCRRQLRHRPLRRPGGVGCWRQRPPTREASRVQALRIRVMALCRCARRAGHCSIRWGQAAGGGGRMNHQCQPAGAASDRP